MLTKKERRTIELQAVKSQHSATLAGPKARDRFRATKESIKAVNATIKRCRSKSSKAKAQEKLRLLHLKADRAIKKYRRCRSDIVIARLILAPRLAWKTDAKGKLSHILMPSDFVVRKLPSAVDLPHYL